jgi:hypothetical protein
MRTSRRPILTRIAASLPDASLLNDVNQLMSQKLSAALA